MELDSPDTQNLQPFDYVDPFKSQQDQASQLLSSFLSANGNLTNIQTISIGSGTKVLRANEQGFWLGANTFANAPFSVSMQGVITSKSTASGNIVTIDGGNGRIVLNDGTTNRVVLGNV